jgi:N-methylhydantoinase A/oxoprolinase/acetone carboxylase beta subunit
MTTATHRLAFDIGGTFTDIVVADHATGALHVHKTLTTPDDPSRGVAQGMRELVTAQQIAPEQLDRVVVGATTLVTNTLLERKGARTSLVTTEGFGDVIEIGREWRFDIYDLHIELPEPLVSRDLRFELRERVDATGAALAVPDEEQLRAMVERLRESGVESVAISLLHSYANNAHERFAAAAVREALPDVHVSMSCEVLPEMREFDRSSATICNAYVQPKITSHLATLGERVAGVVDDAHILLMQSNGGLISDASAAETPIRLLESGPAAGALATARFSFGDSVVGFDMGGTTAKICVIERGTPQLTYEFEAGRTKRFAKGSGYPVHVPSIDLMEIGAGGGSIAWMDRMGLLKVGPQSQGSDPGPACYGLGGTLPTVTDANVVLGFIDPDTFLNGTMPLDREAAERAIETHVAQPLGMSVAEAASGIYRVANNAMATAVRVHLAEHGKDPERMSLIAFGGAGPVHAREIARALRMGGYVVPPNAGVASAVGLHLAPPKVDAVRSCPGRIDELEWGKIAALDRDMQAEIFAKLDIAGVDRSRVTLERTADMRYVGQGFEIHVEVELGGRPDGFGDALLQRFRTSYSEMYGRTNDDAVVELISWRVIGTGPDPGLSVDGGQGAPRESADAVAEPSGRRRGYEPELGDFVEAAIHVHADLRPGATFTGPALVQQAGSTFVIGSGDRAVVDPAGMIRVAGAW